MNAEVERDLIRYGKVRIGAIPATLPLWGRDAIDLGLIQTPRGVQLYVFGADSPSSLAEESLDPGLHHGGRALRVGLANTATEAFEWGVEVAERGFLYLRELVEVWWKAHGTRVTEWAVGMVRERAGPGRLALERGPDGIVPVWSTTDRDWNLVAIVDAGVDLQLDGSLMTADRIAAHSFERFSRNVFESVKSGTLDFPQL